MIRVAGAALAFASLTACASEPVAAEERAATPEQTPPASREEPTGERVRRSSGVARGVDGGLAWLASRQSPDGSWDGDVGATGLAMLAFLGAGETHQSGNHRETVKRGLSFLRDRQAADGSVGSRDTPAALRDHAFAALALCEAYGMTGSRGYEEPARRSAAFALAMRTAGGGWQRPAAAGGGLDVATTGWMVVLLRSATTCEVGTWDTEIAEAVSELDRLVDPVRGRVRGADGGADVGLDTALVLLARVLAGQTPKSHPDLRTMADAVISEPAAFRTALDVERTWAGTMAIYQVGGERWRKWNVPMHKTLLAAQRCGPGDPGDPAEGSWTSVGDGIAAGQVRTTALCCMALGVYFRIGDMEGWRRDGEKWNE